MNNRIFEIIQDMNGRVGLQWEYEDKEELAELIVQECIEQCSKALVEHTGQPSVTHNYAVGLCQDNIKEHFGVEE